MSTRAEFEAALAQAEADWARANEALEQARARLIEANADWDQVVSDRRRADTDRRKAGAVWDRMFPDRRKASADRRSAQADIAALSKAVAERNDAYTRRSNAESDWAEAEARLNAAAGARHIAAADLDGFGRAEKNS
jgi:multidrug resistance efflux pump